LPNGVRRGKGIARGACGRPAAAFTCGLDHVCEAGVDGDDVGVLHTGQHRHLHRVLHRLVGSRKADVAGRAGL
jgi:hypothetical protein